MTKPYSLAVFIGRFQPFHRGHELVVREALEQSKHLLMLVGSARAPRSLRNPWTAEERITMIRAALPPTLRERVTLLPMMDALYHDAGWIEMVQAAVRAVLVQRGEATDSARVALAGHQKDGTSYYLKLFPQWASISVPSRLAVGGTEVRAALLAGDVSRLRDVVSPEVLAHLDAFVLSRECAELRREAEFVADYKKQFAGLKYPPFFVTADAVVMQSGHVLLVKRGARPGLGQWALPGGFVHEDETIQAACLRELREETKLKVPEPVLLGSLKQVRTFDDPFRSSRGRTVTHAHFFALGPAAELPKVRGGDDARRAVWVPLASVEPERMFEDHYFILRALVGHHEAVARA
jgi:bifunctional NMN adenylyltransferase/nudix hydrolase